MYIIASILMIAGIAVMFMNIDSYGLFLGILIVAAGFLCGFIANKMAQAKVQREKDAEAEQARRKAGQLLTQLEAVEKMYDKAVMEEAMLAGKDPADHSVSLYADRLARTKEQCRLRSADIRQQLKLIFALKTQIERESPALHALMD